jgi:hypothetical protein
MYTRRQFLRGLGLATATVAIHSPMDALAGIRHPTPRCKVIVIGAGLAGLCAANWKRAGTRSSLEAHPRRIGGRVFTQRSGRANMGSSAPCYPPQHPLPRHAPGRAGGGCRMSMTRINKTGEPQVNLRATGRRRPGRGTAGQPPAPASAGPWASLACDARIW